MKKLSYFLLLLIATTSCNDKLQSGGPYLQIYIEDDPAQYSNMMVSIEKLEIYNGSTWVTLDFQQASFDILKYTGGSSRLLYNDIVDQGVYTRLRMTYGTIGNILTENDVDIPLTITDEDRVVEMDIDVNARDGIYSVICDLDVAASVDNVELTFKPSMTVMSLDVAGAISGSIAQKHGTTLVDVIYVEAESAEGVVKSTYSNPTNAKFFIRLAQGVYTVRIMPSSISVFAPQTFENIAVMQSQSTQMGKIQLLEKSTTTRLN